MCARPAPRFFRSGEDRGMADTLSLPEPSWAHTPMQWSNEPHGGFTKSDKPLIPVISGGPYGFEHINAAIQRRHPDSLLRRSERSGTYTLARARTLDPGQTLEGGKALT